MYRFHTLALSSENGTFLLIKTFARKQANSNLKLVPLNDQPRIIHIEASGSWDIWELYSQLKTFKPIDNLPSFLTMPSLLDNGTAYSLHSFGTPGR